MSLLLFLAAQAAPAPPAGTRPTDHSFSCKLFLADGRAQRFTGTVRAKGKWEGDLALASPEGGPLPAGTFAGISNGPTGFFVKIPAGDGEEYTYVFARTTVYETRTANGTLVVTKQKWPAPYRHVATGICDFTSQAAS